MNTTTIDVTNTSGLSHSDATGLQSIELERTLELLCSLGPDDWTTQTECPDWDVHRMYLHVLGACEASASIRENVHQMRTARRYRKAHGGPLEAALSHTQVVERQHLSVDELRTRLTEIAPVTVRKRASLPALVRAAKLAIDGPVVEKWKLGYLIDTIYLRDLWMHRVDASVATHRELHLTADHDGVLVADVVTEWARRHGEPFTLQLTGPAGGRFTSVSVGTGTEPAGVITDLDAVEFCRILAGRLPAPHRLLQTIVPF